MKDFPLTGIRVLEVGNYLAAPFACMQLADLGADVIKIESPDGGDQVRLTGPFVDGESAAFVRINRNKRSLALDLKDDAGKEVFRRLAADADIIVENLRPGTMNRIGFGYEALAAGNPGLIYVAASGWGQDGPLAPLPGLDIMAQARSGLMSVTGSAGGDPVKVGVPICDLVCALYGAMAALAALQERSRTGHGQYVDVSLFESGVSFGVWEAAKYFSTGEIAAPMGSAHQTLAPYQAVRSADGWFTVGATTTRTWPAFCRALGLEHLETDPRYKDVTSRQENVTTLIEAIEERTTTRDKQHWIDVLNTAGVPCAPIQDYGQVFTDAHLRERDYFWDAPHPHVGPVRQLGSPMRFSRTPVRRDRGGPLLGEDSTQVLGELGLSEADIRSLADRGVTLTAERPVRPSEATA